MSVAADTLPAPRPRFAQVPFHGAQILAARDGDVVRVPMRQFCETIGLPWPALRRRITRDEILAEGVVMMTTPSAGGEQEAVTLPLDLIPGFLFGAEAARFAPELRERVRLFRRECFAVLHRHFFPAAPASKLVPVTPPAAPVTWQELDAARRSAPALLAAIAIEQRPEIRRYLHGLLVHDADRLGLTPPTLGELGDDAGVRLDALLEGLKTLTARRVKWNHAINRRMAINLPELARLFAKHDIDIQIDDALRAALSRSTPSYRITCATIERSAITGKAVFCTILDPWGGA